ncbi:phosphatase PAP2 family protein [Pseudomonas sp.]|uniref:phosphatase PAP2 family protein n=1 Tax=Pseudomonas sp. TaxID=306 RepID=UPI003C4BB676
MVDRLTRGILRADGALLNRCSRSKPPRTVRLFIVACSRGGDGWLWWSAGLLVLSFGGTDRLQAFSAAFLSACSAVLLFARLKVHIRRPRPHGPHRWARIAAPDQFSFPSGHSMTAFAVCSALFDFYPHWWPILLVIAVAVATSRVILGLHYLTDVLAGAVIGSALGAIWSELLRGAGA